MIRKKVLVQVYTTLRKPNIPTMKQLIKNITPPIVYAPLKRLLVKPKIFSPVWNTLTYKPIDGIQVFFDPTGPWQKTILNNTHETFLFERLRVETLQGKVIFDIGAHVGFHSLYFARLVGPKGKVYAFEPNPKNVERFKLIRDKNDDIRNTISIFDIAVSNCLRHRRVQYERGHREWEKLWRFY